MTRRARRISPAARALKAKVIAALIQGLTLDEAAEVTKVKKSTIIHWRDVDDEFNEMLAETEEVAVEAFLMEGLRQVRNQIMDLGPRAVEVLRESLGHPDQKVRLQAAGMVLRHGGGPAERLGIVGLEKALGDLNADPAQGD